MTASLAAIALGTQKAQAQTDTDSLRMEELQEVVVRGVKAQKGAPFAVENIKRKELTDFAKTGKELPFLFAQTPGVLAWSENGVGTGTTYMRIRGAGDSRMATRALTSLLTVCHSTLPKTSACSGRI